MTIAEQVAHDFLDSVEKNIVANKLDIKSLETNTYYQTKDEVKMEVADKKTGVVIATMKCNFDTSRIKKEIKKQMIDVLEDYCNKNICVSCKLRHACESKKDFPDMIDEEMEGYVSYIKEKNTDVESQNECELEKKKMEQVKVLKEVTRIFYPNRMEEVIPIKEFVKNITDKGYKVMIKRENAMYDVVIYEEEELKE